MKRVFGMVEAVFDGAYLIIALIIGFFLILTRQGDQAAVLAGIMAVTLAGGDAFHLIPRIMVIVTKQEERLRAALGRGKQITSITMTVFYLILWQVGLMIYAPAGMGFWTGLVYALAVVRILLCLMPQNQWTDRYPPVSWGVWRNIPFFLLGAAVAILFFVNRSLVPGLGFMWLAIVLSFGFYIPVVLWSNRNPKVGILMLPKTCAYLWVLFMCLYL